MFLGLPGGSSLGLSRGSPTTQRNFMCSGKGKARLYRRKRRKEADTAIAKVKVLVCHQCSAVEVYLTSHHKQAVSPPLKFNTCGRQRE